MASSKKYAMILSGGSARGAYEVGVLKYLFQEIPKHYGTLPKFDIICGTSVGAFHACWLAAHQKTIASSISRLDQIWTTLKPTAVVQLGWDQVASWKNIVTGGKSGSLLDITPLKILLTQEGNWSEIRKNIDNGLLETLCVSTTSARSGKTVVFTETNQPFPDDAFRTNFKPTKISIEHALASASIPILFPPVQIGGEWFSDGGIRQNTPIAPAVAFQATHVFSIGLWHERKQFSTYQNDPAPSAGRLIGKIFNSFFIDHAQSDIHNLDTLNQVIRAGTELYGEEFADHLANMEKPFRYIESCAISPSRDIGRMAGDYLTNKKYKQNRVYRNLLKLIDIGTFEADLASYLLFDGSFSRLLIDLGFQDAANNEIEIAKFLGLV
jgi:NTE family protein